MMLIQVIKYKMKTKKKIQAMVLDLGISIYVVYAFVQVGQNKFKSTSLRVLGWLSHFSLSGV